MEVSFIQKIVSSCLMFSCKEEEEAKFSWDLHISCKSTGNNVCWHFPKEFIFCDTRVQYKNVCWIVELPKISKSILKMRNPLTYDRNILIIWKNSNFEKKKKKITILFQLFFFFKNFRFQIFFFSNFLLFFWKYIFFLLFRLHLKNLRFEAFTLKLGH